jgi:hypothetical protein
MNQRLIIKKVELLIFISIFCATVFIFLTYQTLDSNKIKDLVLPGSIGEASFTYYIINKATSLEQENYFRNLYIFNLKEHVYRLKPTLSQSEKNDFRTRLYEIGYYEDASSVDRDIGTREKLILNGYLGQFFRFKLLGNLNWLIFFVFAYLLFNIKKRSRTELVLLAFYVAATMVIIKGGYNYRYQLTLLPLTLWVIFYYINELTKKPIIVKYRLYIFGFLLMISGYNTLKSFQAINPKLGSIKNNTISTQTTSKETFDDMVIFINNLPIDSNNKVLVNNLPEYFYYINKPGAYCWFNDASCYGTKGWEVVLNQESMGQLADNIKTKLKCKYILSTVTFNNYNTRIKQFLNTNTKLIRQSGDYVLYEIY